MIHPVSGPGPRARFEGSRTWRIQLEGEIAQRLDEHQDAGIFTSLPYAGRGVRGSHAARRDRRRSGAISDEESLAALAGVSPVTRASGKLNSVKFRWACDKRLRDAIVDFAEHSRFSPPWAAALYANAIASGKRHPHATRILARAWVRVSWRMWLSDERDDVITHRRRPRGSREGEGWGPRSPSRELGRSRDTCRLLRVREARSFPAEVEHGPEGGRNTVKPARASGA